MILQWDIGGVEVLEMPGHAKCGEQAYFSRSLRIGKTPALTLPIVATSGGVISQEYAGGSLGSGGGTGHWNSTCVAIEHEGKAVCIGATGSAYTRGRRTPPWSETERPFPFDFSVSGGSVHLHIVSTDQPVDLKVAIWTVDLASAEESLRKYNRAGPRGWHPESTMDVQQMREDLAAGRTPTGAKTQEEWIRLGGVIPEVPDIQRPPQSAPAAAVETTGELSTKTDDAYVVDTIKLPDPNPWGAPMFTSGIDFFESGERIPDTGKGADKRGTGDLSGIRSPGSGIPWSAAVCTFHGDVFLVAGLDAKLEKVTWKRFATGLYHPLGLRIVKGEIYVTCRDGLWRLHDRNGDGEADHYEAFNFDLKATRNFHEFVFDLQTDPAGNFYFAKAGPVKNGGRGFDPIMEHHGKVLRVSPDGRKLDVVASGFRAPNGIGCGPRGELTSGDNEGTWTPACKINWITPGGFYGVVPLAHRAPAPTDYDRPLCWLPKRVDNSGGGQVWAPEGWGPWSGKLLHLSYGQSALYGVMMEAIANRQSPVGNAPMQGGVTKFPLTFQSGIMRARFSPHDGQLYVTGLRGWQTNGLKNGCLQRVRYTGAETRMPVELHVKKDGIELRFACSLDTQSARDPEAWNVEQWRYLWSAAYGSPELSTEGETPALGDTGRDGEAQFSKAQMSTAKHDPVTVKSVTIGTDDRTVFLEIPGLKPVMQMQIKYDLKTAEGKDLRGEVVNTIHALGTE